MKSFLFLIFSLFSLAQAHECRGIFIEDRVSYFQSQLSEGQFRDDRRYSEYSNTFSSTEVRLSTVLESLPKDSIWMDMGAGMAYAITHGLSRNTKISGVALSYKMPPDLKLSAGYIKDLGDRFQYLDGDYIENMASGGRLNPWMGKTSVITDLFGPFSYTNDIARVLQINLDLLKEQGQLFFFFNNDRTQFTRDGVVFSAKITDWLRTIPGIEVKTVNVLSHTSILTGIPEEVVSVQIIKKLSDIRVPTNLILKDLQYDSPVRRQYEWK